MGVSAVFVWFVIYSVFGWVYESTYCTINERKWENRGFLYGPCCPIYGTGIMSMMLLWHSLTQQGLTPEWYQVFLVSMVGSAILEYATSWTLERLFHARWWDYSNMPLNLNGRISVPSSVFFGLGGLLVVYVLYEPTLSITTHAALWVMELLSLVLAFIIAADTAITVSALKRIARAASTINRRVNEHMDQLVAGAVERGGAAAASLAERRDGAVQAIVGVRDAALDAALETSSALTERLAGTTKQDDSFIEERERFAASLRDTWLGNMSHVGREALRRAKSYTPKVGAPNIPGAEQLGKLMSDVRAKHWQRDDERDKAA